VIVPNGVAQTNQYLLSAILLKYIKTYLRNIMSAGINFLTSKINHY